MKIIFLFLQLGLFSFLSYGQKEYNDLAISQDSTYGYTPENPLKLKKGNQEKSILHSRLFLNGLKTQDNQNLVLLARESGHNPNYKKPAIVITDRAPGLPLGGKLGILDKYIFLTSVKKDTISIFVDIYNKGKLMLPAGLKYEQPQ
jgi:hypothetical protein